MIKIGSLGTNTSFPSSQNEPTNAVDAHTSPSKRISLIDRSQVDPKILEAAEGMETMFIDYMQKIMRQTVPKNEMDMESPATEIYRGMLDSEFAKTAAKHGGIGLSDLIIAYLDTKGYTHPKGNNVPPKEKP